MFLICSLVKLRAMQEKLIGIRIQSLQTGALDQPKGWDGEGDEEFQKGGDICVPMADSFC